MAPIVLEPTEQDLASERASLLQQSRLTEDELRDRAASYRLSVDELRIVRRLGEIDFLLGLSD